MSILPIFLHTSIDSADYQINRLTYVKLMSSNRYFNLALQYLLIKHV